MDKLTKQKQLVLAQLLASSPTLKLSIGVGAGTKTYTRDQIIQHVEAMDDMGEDYVRTQMEFMRALKTGEIYSLLSEVKKD